MRQAQPDFDAVLAKRHSQLRHLYRLFLKRHRTSRRRAGDIDAHEPDAFQDLPPEPVRTTQKPGRNDPCPCGSGKKYKKCCGRN
jgi:preprotein translocase subunit SecA